MADIEKQQKNIKKDKIWTYNREKSELSSTETEIFFKLTKVKDDITKRERLLVVAKRGANDISPKVSISLLNLENGFLGLREYGVILQRIDITDIKRRVEENYNDIDIDEEEKDIDISEETLRSIINIICEYIVSNSIEKRDGKYYDIGVREFAEIIKSSDYDIDMRKLRRKLKDAGSNYIVSSSNERTDMLVRDAKSGKPVRVIAFDAIHIADQLDTIKNELGID